MTPKSLLVFVTRRPFVFAPLLWALGGCSRTSPPTQPISRGTTVLALGDSLTYGTGAPAESSYPNILAQLTGWNIVNAGVPGDTSAQALERVGGLLSQHQPALVLLCIGGNDLLRRGDEAALRDHLQRLCDAVRASGAQLLLIAVPRPTLTARFTGSLTDHPVYGEIAERLALPLHRRGWSEVLANDALRSDAIHANAAGYDAFARGLLATLRTTGLWVG
jgi:acyl-CoA thioesterase-1